MAFLSFNGVSTIIFLVSICLFLPFSARAQTTHIVGGNMGWVIPSGDAGAYTTWATSKTFTVGDKLVFNYAAGQHDVTQSSKAAYDACNASMPIISTTMTAPATITLTTSGQKYFICTIGRHCALGQKLAINVVSAAVSSPSPTPSLSPVIPRKVGAPAPAAQSPAPAPVTLAESPGPSALTGEGKTYTVGDSMGWTVPQGGEADYKTWASDKNFAVGDTLVFQFTTGSHDVAEVKKSSYGSCTSSNSISKQTTGPARIILTSPGEHFYICTFGSHCSLGQKLAINVTGTTASPSPTSDAIPPSTPNLSSPSPDATIPSTTSPNHAHSTSVSALCALVLSIFVAYMLH